MKRRAVIVLALAAVLLFTLTVSAFATSYNYDGTFSHLVYCSPTFHVTGVTSCVGSQSAISGPSPWIQYALVTRNNSDPAADTLWTWKILSGAQGYSFSFQSINKYNIRLRFYNMNYGGGGGTSRTSGTYSGSFAIQ